MPPHLLSSNICLSVFFPQSFVTDAPFITAMSKAVPTVFTHYVISSAYDNCMRPYVSRSLLLLGEIVPETKAVLQFNVIGPGESLVELNRSILLHFL